MTGEGGVNRDVASAVCRGLNSAESVIDCAACGCAIWSWFKLDSLLLCMSARYVLEEGLNRPAFI